MELMLFEIEEIYNKQYYLELLYKALFVTGYYALMRIGELTKSEHVIKARDIHLGDRGDKFLLILRSSKTHSKNDRPQKIRISSANKLNAVGERKSHFCPVKILAEYIRARPLRPENDLDQQLFVFRDGSPVLGSHLRKNNKNINKQDRNRQQMLQCTFISNWQGN